MAEWCAQVIDFVKFSRETVGIGMSYLDRFMASGVRRSRTAMTDRKEYQLAAMTALYMAIKLNEPLEMETKLLSDLSRGCYTTAEIATMEIDILEALDWRVAGPTPLEFVQHFLAVGLHDTEAANHPAVEATLLDFSRFQTELAIGMPALLSATPSRIALAAILNSMEGIDDVALNPFERITFLRSIEATSGLDPNARGLRPVRSLLMDGFVKNAGISFQQVAAQLGLGAQREEATRAAQASRAASSSSDGSGPEVSPVCVSVNVSAISKKQRCV
uniref:Cyclin N-terminal domain-containing protein n=1 Tax=Minutocellus polymorphus TaxID=265543 RepID=A0A7S0AYS6_9STRA